MRRLDYHYTISSVVKWIKYVLECLRIYMRTSITKLKLFGLASTTTEHTMSKVLSNSLTTKYFKTQLQFLVK